MSEPVRIAVDEADARRILLAQAIEITDTRGELISDVERDQLDVRALEEARAASAGRSDRLPDARHIAPALSRRAGGVLDVVAGRDPQLASLRQAPSWRAQVVGGLPLVALLLGVLTDQVANPHRIDLLSPPLLALVLWNVAVYAFLVARALRRPRGEATTPAGFRTAIEWLLQPRGAFRGVRAEIRTRFLIAWQAAAARVSLQRATLILHLCAAAWAAGVALSLFVRGLVWQYRVGWEATFLTAEQLQSLLALLFWPVTALTALEPFTLNEIVAMRFDAASDAVSANALANGRHWVLLYAGLLAIVVVAPRLVLAAWAALRMKFAARRLSLSLADPYFQQLIDRLVPARVAIAVVTQRAEDRAALDRVLAQHATGAGALIATSSGDALLATGAEAGTPSIRASEPEQETWSTRMLGWLEPVVAADMAIETNPVDVVLHLVGAAEDLDAPLPAGAADAPILLLVRANDPAATDALLGASLLRRKHHPAIADVLAFDAFARCWVLEPRLLDAIGAALPRSKAQGFARLESEWELRNRKRLGDAMGILAGALATAAREIEEVKSAPLSLKVLVSRDHRASRETAKTDAMAAVVERLKAADGQTLRELARLHRLTDGEAAAAERVAQTLAVRVDTRVPVDASQAGLAGAASGAAMGASVDLVTGGLTLGVAALLGALVGGSAAFVSAAWNNRKSPSGATTIQLSDEMLQALVEASLLRYLAVIHLGRSAAAPAEGGEIADPAWSSEVVAAVEAERPRLVPLWKAIRTSADAGDATPDAASQLPAALRAIAIKVLRALYPDARIAGE